VISAKCFRVSLHQMRVKFFQSFNSINAKSSHFTEPVIQHLVNANCKPHLLYGSEVIAWNNSELSNIAYAFNSAMCRIYNVSLKLLLLCTIVLDRRTFVMILFVGVISF